ncbi:hypothetical protein RND71_040692 [Anisodus tanguticus]|uniref:Small ribosomal subunit protein uS7 domain-containing protein n=1 Tax=Anisodus tanguticus TaxID=243964 RepID=A0AAE1QT31_9SOLA|nr:hypothetical protein RND71_040692 [Anisodus tanguticus]
MAFKLSSELVDAAKGSGDVIRKKQETHRMAEANRAFSSALAIGSLRLRVGCLIVQAVMIVSCTLTGGSLFLTNGEDDRNVPLKDSTETKMGCQERR